MKKYICLLQHLPLLLHKYSCLDGTTRVIDELLHINPKAQKMLRKQFNLPSFDNSKSHAKFYSFLGFYNNILAILHQNVSTNATSREICAVVFDEMTIKEERSYNIKDDNVEGGGGLWQYKACFNSETIFTK